MLGYGIELMSAYGRKQPFVNIGNGNFGLECGRLLRSG